MRRKLTLARRGNKRKVYTKEVLTQRYQESEILDSLLPNRKKKFQPIFVRRVRNEIDISGFSFIDSIDNTINKLKEIALSDCRSLEMRINFEDNYVTDIAPYLVLGIMRRDMSPVISGGRITPSVQKVVEAVNIHEFLGMRPLNRVDRSQVWPMPLQQRHGSGQSTSKNIAKQPTKVEIVADNTAEYVNEWLSMLSPPSNLTDFGAGRIKAFVTEVLNNAERHGRQGGDGEWIAAGFMAKREVAIGDDSQSLHICHLAFYNPGRSIAESIQSAPTEVVAQIRRYASYHPSSKLTEDALSTVFSLQDGISRIPQGGAYPTGGTGIMDIAEFVNAVGTFVHPDWRPRVAILSGSTYISLHGDHSQGQSDGSGRRLQWFNARNDPTDPPSKEHVRDLPIKFPGTVITMRFVIDEQIIESETGE